MMEKNDQHVCPVCGKHIFEDFNSFEECPVYGWMDDAVQEKYPDWYGCANDMSLKQARQAYKEGRKVE